MGLIAPTQSAHGVSDPTDPRQRVGREPLSLARDCRRDVCGQLIVCQQLIDERRHDVLPGDAGQAEAVGQLALPLVERAVLNRRQVDRTAYGLLPNDGLGR